MDAMSEGNVVNIPVTVNIPNNICLFSRSSLEV